MFHSLNIVSIQRYMGVFHQKFGYGEVVGIEGDKLEISFDKAGIKKVVSRYLSASDDVPF